MSFDLVTKKRISAKDNEVSCAIKAMKFSAKGKKPAKTHRVFLMRIGMEICKQFDLQQGDKFDILYGNGNHVGMIRVQKNNQGQFTVRRNNDGKGALYLTNSKVPSGTKTEVPTLVCLWNEVSNTCFDVSLPDAALLA